MFIFYTLLSWLQNINISQITKGFNTFVCEAHHYISLAQFEVVLGFPRNSIHWVSFSNLQTNCFNIIFEFGKIVHVYRNALQYYGVPWQMTFDKIFWKVLLKKKSIQTHPMGPKRQVSKA